MLILFLIELQSCNRPTLNKLFYFSLFYSWLTNHLPYKSFPSFLRLVLYLTIALSGGASAVKEPGPFEVKKILLPGHPDALISLKKVGDPFL